MPDMPDYVRAIYTSVKNGWQDAENLDDAHGYVSYIWIPEETFKVDIMKLHIYAEKFRAHSKAALAGGGTVVTSGASSEVTTEGGGAHSHSVTGATSSEETPSHTHLVNIGTKTSEAGGASHRHNVTIGVETSQAKGGHSHSVSGTTSSEDGGTHSHQVVIGFETSQYESTHKHKIGGVTVDEVKAISGFMALYDDEGGLLARVLTEHLSSGQPYTYGMAQAHSHGVDYGTKTSNASFGLHDHTVSGQTTDTEDDHTHNVDFGTKTSEYKTATHSHSVIIGGVTSEAGGGLHSHSVSGQTAEAVAVHTHGMDHTHQVTIGDHTHGIDFGIYEEDIVGRTLSAVLYDPENVVLKDFGVVLTGEDSDILDLTDYFETLKYGMYRVVLTASGRLRARLVFYELCKMYAQH